jgi:3,4-dihydroxy 2-butanone 4-phosphate synthase
MAPAQDLPAAPEGEIPRSEFDSIPATVASFREGNFVVVLDDPSRENEADLIAPAASLTTAQMAFLVRHSSGYVCAPLAPALADAWGLAEMVPAAQSADPRGTAYTVAVDAADPLLTTGISAHDRALTCRVLAAGPPSQENAAAVNPHGLRRPGHILPLRARPGGVRQRPGHTEAAVDLCRLAGLAPAGVIGEIVDDGVAVPGRALREGSGMLRGEACVAFARQWGLRVCTIADLVAFLEEAEGKWAEGELEK